MTADLFSALESQTLLLNRLRQHGVIVTALTPTAQMVREAIQVAGIEHTICGRGAHGRACTYRAFFEHAYGVKFDVTAAPKRRRRRESSDVVEVAHG